jgi:pimeloyl-ACP methyl ester carboxylesterase
VTGPLIRHVEVNGLRLSLREWGTPGQPQIVLLAGTGLAAAIYAESERLLAPHWHGFTLDRRGQGLSDKPASGYEFHDFAADLIEVAATLGLAGAAGIGHSAGGTDLLLAAAADPTRWSGIAVIEPTVQDPRRPPLPETVPPSWHDSYDRMLRRRPGFASMEVAVERFCTNPGFARCGQALLLSYLFHALELAEDGLLRLRCSPQVEAQMNRSIMQAMQHRYTPPACRPDPFAALLRLAVPTTVVTTGHAGDVYREMARIALEVIPGATALHLPGLGHIVPLESPETIASLAGSLRPSA